MVNKDMNPGSIDRNDDKTVVYSSDAHVVNANPAEKTTVNNQAEKTQVQDPTDAVKANGGAVGNNNSAETNEPASTKEQKKSSGFSAGVFAAGIAGAGIAGVAAGTVFSDEIKGVFTVDSFDAPQSLDVEAQEVSPETHGSDSILVDILGSASDDSASFEVSTTDDDGNVYSVSLVDIDGDGTTDFETGSIQFVDGSSVSYTEMGDSLNPLLTDQSEAASPSEYQGLSEFANLVQPVEIMGIENDTHSYIIQPGDTLSEIAAANNTSIEQLMELNPDITDPDLIYANSELVIPDNDHIGNPYEVDGSIANQPVDFLDSPNISVPYETVGSGAEGDFANVDWASFSDEPVVNDGSDYGNALANTDFNSYETPDNYLDNSYAEPGNDFVSNEFL